ncbi:rod shape-determining protein MreC [Miniphocaeibacter massiliensis]|uniref:rod shape-determining protein MreC n=1 Tax=Miniphocaeibacter massiliensis TaxID=2041841 RepID=UPI000C1C79D4|nr:rod shape-determining protein MreC [Miniphocaeibacter massiliensis]
MNDKFRYSNKKRKGIIFVITVLFLISLIVTSNGNSKIISFGGNVIATITTPITKVIYFTSSKVIEGFEFVFGSADMRRENSELSLENIKLKEEVENMEKTIDNQEYLKDEYELIKNSKLNLIKAYITSLDPSNIYSRFNIDKGSMAGVKEKDTIVQGVLNEDDVIVEGLVGTVTEVGLNFSKVTSIMDGSNKVSFKISRNGEIGVISGGDGNIINGYMYESGASIEVGDSIYTSGLGGIYPPNLYIGKIKEIVEDDAVKKKVVIESPVNFKNMYRVLVLNNEQEIKDE